jgi:hypothetical protein
MIQVPKLLNAVNNRTVIWQFRDIFATREAAMKDAAQLFCSYKGVAIKHTSKDSWIVLYWELLNPLEF